MKEENKICWQRISFLPFYVTALSSAHILPHVNCSLIGFTFVIVQIPGTTREQKMLTGNYNTFSTVNNTKLLRSPEEMQNSDNSKVSL